MFENVEFKRIFGPKREEETRGWRKFHTEELHDLLSSPNITKIQGRSRFSGAWHYMIFGSSLRKIIQNYTYKITNTKLDMKVSSYLRLLPGPWKGFWSLRFISFKVNLPLIRISNQEWCDECIKWHVWKIWEEICTRFYWGTLQKGEH